MLEWIHRQKVKYKRLPREVHLNVTLQLLPAKGTKDGFWSGLHSPLLGLEQVCF